MKRALLIALVLCLAAASSRAGEEPMPVLGGHAFVPVMVLEAPNVAALYRVCSARMGRIAGVARRRRLEGVCRKISSAWERARDRAWIEAFIGPPLPDKGSEAGGAG